MQNDELVGKNLEFLDINSIENRSRNYLFTSTNNQNHFFGIKYEYLTDKLLIKMKHYFKKQTGFITSEEHLLFLKKHKKYERKQKEKLFKEFDKLKDKDWNIKYFKKYVYAFIPKYCDYYDEYFNK
jgi:hypothetical protein